MTFFANAGVTFPPDVQTKTKEAGEKSLEAAADIYRHIASLERGERKIGEFLPEAVAALERAAEIYEEIASKVSLASIRVWPEEFDYAAVSDWSDVAPESYLELNVMYLRLASMARGIAASLRSLYRARPDLIEDLASPVFVVMRQWERMAALARLVATVNRREHREA